MFFQLKFLGFVIIWVCEFCHNLRFSVLTAVSVLQFRSMKCIHLALFNWNSLKGKAFRKYAKKAVSQVLLGVTQVSHQLILPLPFIFLRNIRFTMSHISQNSHKIWMYDVLLAYYGVYCPFLSFLASWLPRDLTMELKTTYVKTRPRWPVPISWSLVCD